MIDACMAGSNIAHRNVTNIPDGLSAASSSFNRTSTAAGSAISRASKRARLIARTMNIEAGIPLPETSPTKITSRSGPAAQTP